MNKYERAISNLTMLLGSALKSEWLDDDDIEEDLAILNELCKITVEKTVKAHSDEVGDSEVATKRITVFTCPTCGSELVDEEYNNCPWCGQAISWYK